MREGAKKRRSVMGGKREKKKGGEVGGKVRDHKLLTAPN